MPVYTNFKLKLLLDGPEPLARGKIRPGQWRRTGSLVTGMGPAPWLRLRLLQWTQSEAAHARQAWCCAWAWLVTSDFIALKVDSECKLDGVKLNHHWLYWHLVIWASCHGPVCQSVQVVVEFKLQVRVTPGLPVRASAATTSQLCQSKLLSRLGVMGRPRELLVLSFDYEETPFIFEETPLQMSDKFMYNVKRSSSWCLVSFTTSMCWCWI